MLPQGGDGAFQVYGVCQMREYLPWSVEISCHNWGSGFTDDEAFASGIDDGFGDQEHAIDL
jgi:hypothetical protein